MAVQQCGESGLVAAGRARNGARAQPRHNPRRSGTELTPRRHIPGLCNATVTNLAPA